MARIVGAVTTSHVPAIGGAIAKGIQNEPYWKPFFGAWDAAHAWIEKVKPDVAVVVYNDHGLQFFLDKMPTFAVGAAADYRNEDEGWGLPVLNSFPGDADFSWHLIESLVADEFDIVSCQEMAVDHGFVVPMGLLWPGEGRWPVKSIPISINTVQHPLPTPARCYKFGQAIGRFQRVQDHIIHIVNYLDAARWTTYEALWKLDSGADAACSVHMAKSVASESYMHACNYAHEVHAGIGVVREYGLTLHTKMSRSLYHCLGAPKLHRKYMERALGLVPA